MARRAAPARPARPRSRAIGGASAPRGEGGAGGGAPHPGRADQRQPFFYFFTRVSFLVEGPHTPLSSRRGRRGRPESPRQPPGPEGVARLPAAARGATPLPPASPSSGAPPARPSFLPPPPPGICFSALPPLLIRVRGRDCPPGRAPSRPRGGGAPRRRDGACDLGPAAVGPVRPPHRPAAPRVSPARAHTAIFAIGRVERRVGPALDHPPPPRPTPARARAANANPRPSARQTPVCRR